eukprot:m.508311 g.508311  ORF g.508311 m.508311 type:complete len:178 (+) comp21881_c0_seq43:1783-2316(+)
MTVPFTGKWLPSNVKLGRRSSEKFFPAASLMAYQHVQFNFGNMPYRYPPPGECRSFNNVMSMSDAEKEAHRIVPRLVVLEELRREQLVEDTSPRCQICFDDSPNTRLQPCGHKYVPVCFQLCISVARRGAVDMLRALCPVLKSREWFRDSLLHDGTYTTRTTTSTPRFTLSYSIACL